MNRTKDTKIFPLFKNLPSSAFLHGNTGAAGPNLEPEQLTIGKPLISEIQPIFASVIKPGKHYVSSFISNT